MLLPEHTLATVGRTYVRFPVALSACMGGRCAIRATCARYHAADRREPAERLCAPSQHDAWQPVNVIPTGTDQDPFA